MALALLVEDDLELVLQARVAGRGLDEEAVELRLRERERPLVLHRVLGREEQERLPQRTRDAVNGHLPLGHRLQHRRLGLRHRAVDLVHENRGREDGTRAELELACLLVVDGEARNVVRLKVGRALDARVDAALDAACDRACEDGLRRPRHVLEENVALAGKGGEHELDLLVLTAHDRLEVREEARGDLDRGVGRLAHASSVGAPTVRRNDAVAREVGRQFAR